MPRLGGGQTSQSYLISKRNSLATLPTTNEYVQAPSSGNGVGELSSFMNNKSKGSMATSGGTGGNGLSGMLSPRVPRSVSHSSDLPMMGNGHGHNETMTPNNKSTRSVLRAAEGGKGTLLPNFTSTSQEKRTAARIRTPPSRSKSSGPSLQTSSLNLSLRGSRSSSSSSQQILPQTQQDLGSSGGGGGGGGPFSALRRRTATGGLSDDELESTSVRSGGGRRRDYRTDSDAFYRSTNRRSSSGSASGRGSSLWGVTQHGNFTSWAKLSRMKVGHILQVIIVLSVTALVWESHHKALFAAQQLTQFKDEESLLLLHLQKIEQQSIQLHENLSRLARVGMTGGKAAASDNEKNDGKDVDFDLIHKQTQQLYQMEEELNHEVKTLQTRIQQSARNHIIQEFGEGPVQIILELDFGNNNSNGNGNNGGGGPDKIAILLWHDTPHAAWTWLEQIGRHVWDGSEFQWKQGHIIDAVPHEVDPMGGKIEFVEQSNHGHEAWTVGVRETDSGAMGMYINLQDNTNLHKHETCVGKVIDGFDALQRLLEVARSHRDDKNAAIVVRKATAMHVTKKEGI